MFNFLKKIYTETKTISVDGGATVSVTFDFDLEKPLFVKTLDISLGTSTTINYIKVDGINIGNSANNDFESRFGDLPAVEREIEINLTNSDTSAHDTTIKVEGLITK